MFALAAGRREWDVADERGGLENGLPEVGDSQSLDVDLLLVRF